MAKTPPPRKFLVQGAGEDTPVIAPTPASARAVFASSYNPEFAIPPNDGNYLAPPMDITFLKDVEIVRMRPHAHVRGKSAQYKVTYPDGREEIVLNVPRYDFNWQLSYGTSLKLPKGARMHFEFRYDNSVNNKINPDPGPMGVSGISELGRDDGAQPRVHPRPRCGHRGIDIDHELVLKPIGNFIRFCCGRKWKE